MLVLSRKKGQAINIGHNIKIVVIDVQKDLVRVGIEAPDNVDIYRSEIYEAIQKENLNALPKQNLDVLNLNKLDLNNFRRDNKKNNY